MFFQYTGDPIPPLKRKAHKETEGEISESKNSKGLPVETSQHFQSKNHDQVCLFLNQL